jgi:hemolysin D
MAALQESCEDTSAGMTRQFLPAALEIQETPASPVGHLIMWFLLCLALIGVVWAYIGEVDIVVTAPGRIVPSGQVKSVQAPEAGSVANILVEEGSQVQEGQALLRLDATYAAADDRRLRQQLRDVIVQSAWRNAFELQLAASPGARPVQLVRSDMSSQEHDQAMALYASHSEEAAAKLLKLDKELAAVAAEERALGAEKQKLEATLAILTERVATYRTLLDQQYGARVQYLEILQQQTELGRTVPVLESRRRQLLESAAAISAHVDATRAELRRQNLMELSQLSGERLKLEQELLKSARHRRQQVIYSPVSGTVQELAVHTVGGVVSAAQELMKIVPANASVEVEALLDNKDIGFVNHGHAAQVKVTTFNFTKYGLIDAEILGISNDAIEDAQLGWVFRMRLRLLRDSVTVEGRSVKLSPGMAVTAEIKTGRRRLIEFFLSPLLRYRQESVRER